MVLSGKPVDEHVEDRPGGAIAGVPADPERLAREVLQQAVDIGLADVDLFDAAVAVAPVPGGRAAAERLDLLPEHRAAFEQQLEAIVVGRVVAARHLDAAIDIEIMRGEIEHGRGTHADQRHVDPAFGEAADQRRFEHPGVETTVAADREPPRAFLLR